MLKMVYGCASSMTLCPPSAAVRKRLQLSRHALPDDGSVKPGESTTAMSLEYWRTRP
jgi:hypothetical protein